MGGAFQGIIPACAGSTLRKSTKTNTRRDHPRMRGEHSIHVYTSAPASGSSPHARGAHIAYVIKLFTHGIIPACAGSTLRDQRVWSPFSLNTFTFCKPWPPERSL